MIAVTTNCATRSVLPPARVQTTLKTNCMGPSVTGSCSYMTCRKASGSTGRRYLHNTCNRLAVRWYREQQVYRCPSCVFARQGVLHVQSALIQLMSA